MSDEDELRRLLTDAAPEPPRSASDPRPAAAVGRRGRRRVQVFVGVLAASVIATGGVLFWPSNEQTAIPDVLLATGTEAPYDVAPCPANQPPEPAQRTRGPEILDPAEIAQMKAIRVCTWPDDKSDSLGPDPELRLATDALVFDVAGFADSLGRLPAYDANRCALLDFYQPPTMLMVESADGVTGLTRMMTCSKILIQGRAVDSSSVIQAYVEALDSQRSNYDYTRPWSGPLKCDSFGVGSPVEPGREQIIRAIACTEKGELIGPIEGKELERLRTAWTDTREPDERLNSGGENECTEATTGPVIVLATDRSDTVHMRTSPCGSVLNFGGFRPGDTRSLPITPSDLGIP